MYNKLDDITLYYYPQGEKAKTFTLKQNVISDLYVQYLNGYKPQKTSRISVELKDSDYIRGYFGSILLVDARFDKDSYWKLTDREKNELILDTIHRIAMSCAEKYNWDSDVFINAYKKVIQADFIYKIELERKMSKDKKHKASILIEKNEIDALISVLFHDKDNNLIKKIELLRTFNWQGFHVPIVKEHKWFDNNSFGLSFYKDQLILKAYLDKDKSDILINPKDKLRNELLGRLTEMTYRELNSENDITEWINK
jgi:hypothetical protein